MRKIQKSACSGQAIQAFKRPLAVLNGGLHGALQQKTEMQRAGLPFYRQAELLFKAHALNKKAETRAKMNMANPRQLIDLLQVIFKFGAIVIAENFGLHIICYI
jgi:hypothetical protein